jgi:hypothetical protein
MHIDQLLHKSFAIGGGGKFHGPAVQATNQEPADLHRGLKQQLPDIAICCLSQQEFSHLLPVMMFIQLLNERLILLQHFSLILEFSGHQEEVEEEGPDLASTGGDLLDELPEGWLSGHLLLHLPATSLLEPRSDEVESSGGDNLGQGGLLAHPLIEQKVGVVDLVLEPLEGAGQVALVLAGLRAPEGLAGQVGQVELPHVLVVELEPLVGAVLDVGVVVACFRGAHVDDHPPQPVLVVALRPALLLYRVLGGLELAQVLFREGAQVEVYWEFVVVVELDLLHDVEVVLEPAQADYQCGRQVLEADPAPGPDLLLAPLAEIGIVSVQDFTLNQVLESLLQGPLALDRHRHSQEGLFPRRGVLPLADQLVAQQASEILFYYVCCLGSFHALLASVEQRVQEFVYVHLHPYVDHVALNVLENLAELEGVLVGFLAVHQRKKDFLELEEAVLLGVVWVFGRIH